MENKEINIDPTTGGVVLPEGHMYGPVHPDDQSDPDNFKWTVEIVNE